jgi:RNA polymerase primary sigma factor
MYALQTEALDAWRTAGRRGIVEAVTGSGKTQIGAEAIREALADRRHVVVLVPSQELQQQWAAILAAEFGSVTQVQLLGNGNNSSPNSARLLVAIVHSARELRTVPKGSLLVADECHHYAAPAHSKALLPDFEWRLGLTATLEHVDGRHRRLIDYFGPIVSTIDFVKALSDGVIAPFSIAMVGLPMSNQEASAYLEMTREISSAYGALVGQFGVDTSSFGSFMRSVNRLASTSEYAGAAANRFRMALFERRRLLGNSGVKAASVEQLVPAIDLAERTLVFTSTIASAQALAERLRSLGITALSTDSNLSGIERRQRLDWFKRDDIKVLVAPRILDEGVDVPAADLAIVVAGAQSRRQMIQRMGRILRRKSDGEPLARLAVMFLQGTVEDPVAGGYEGFLREVLDVADDIAVFRSDQMRDANVFLASRGGLGEARLPRWEGEPVRTPIWTPPTEPFDVRRAFQIL